MPDLVCNVLGDDDDRNVLALGEAREGRLDLLRRCLCDAMRSNTEYFFLGGGRNEVRSELLGDAFLAIVLTRVDDEEVRVLPVVLVPDAREEEPRHRVLLGREKVVVDGEQGCVSELWSSSRPRDRRSSPAPESSGVSPRRR